MSKFSLVLALVLTAASASAADLIVDATGAGGAYLSIGAAMNDAQVGDRILVKPGSYPYYEHHVGVPVIGLGATPAEVVVRSIYFHVNTPTTGYDVTIQNLTVSSADPGDYLGIHGNEAGPGSLVLDGIHVLGGGVFVRGGESGFYLNVSNSTIAPNPGYGFSGEACYVGGPGNYVEIRNTKIVGWNATPSSFAAGGIGLRLFGGTTARISGSSITGGSGAASSGYEAGGAAVWNGGSGDIALRIDGVSTLIGGDGAGGPGGDGVTIPGSIELGAATVSGGNGTPPGDDFGLAQPAPMLHDLDLALIPNLFYGDGGTFIKSGDTLGYQTNVPGWPSAVAISFGVDVPGTFFFPLSPASLKLVTGSGFSLSVPSIPGYTLPGLMLFAQGLIQNPSTGGLLLTNTTAMRVDLE